MEGDGTFHLGRVELGTFDILGEMSGRGAAGHENCRGCPSRNAPLTWKEEILIKGCALDCDEGGGNRAKWNNGGAVWS